MTMSKGHILWFIPDGYIPPESSGELESHESICVLNCYKEPARLSVTVYFEDRDPIENIEVTVPGRRTDHIRTSSLSRDGESIPKGVPYAMEVESDRPVIVQYSRLDSTQAENSLMTTMAFPG
ncbi:sensory rhodopsin transducer [Paenibacillus aurantius]|uniref:Sensory rhodopsin transducer n=1 Tax=Paenibacillus aurantius TaxID=2918900 RepID=A0AA96LA53_9BACL|nr:sensory rhodopsin transducer [Paenibacillus aurantius]WNQ09498.1 sensory rhodopsin transducer [Paenibacillus aurantius]